MRRAFLCRRGVLAVLTVVAALALGVTALAETASGGITVTELSLAPALAEGVPASTVTSFARGSSPIYCFMRLENSTRRETAVFVRFEPATGEPASFVGGIRLRVPNSPRYRTFARTGSDMAAGSYRCVVRDEGGAVLRSADFQVTE